MYIQYLVLEGHYTVKVRQEPVLAHLGAYYWPGGWGELAPQHRHYM